MEKPTKCDYCGVHHTINADGNDEGHKFTKTLLDNMHKTALEQLPKKGEVMKHRPCWYCKTLGKNC